MVTKTRPKTTYKVWIMIEEFDEERQSGEDVGPIDMGCTATYRTYDAAFNLAKALHTSARAKRAPGWTA